MQRKTSRKMPLLLPRHVTTTTLPNTTPRISRPSSPLCTREPLPAHIVRIRVAVPSPRHFINNRALIYQFLQIYHFTGQRTLDSADQSPPPGLSTSQPAPPSASAAAQSVRSPLGDNPTIRR